jgi:hypothetical protein
MPTGLLIVYLLIFASFGCIYLGTRTLSLLPHICNRWIRWILFGLLPAEMATGLRWTTKPFGVIFASGLLLWVLLDSMYAWFSITLVSKSDIPLFPRYYTLEQESWPTHPLYLELKQAIEALGLRWVQTQQAKISDRCQLKAVFFENKERTLRLQALFAVPLTGRLQVSCTCFTQQAPDQLIATDNATMPFGGYYPQGWSWERKPWLTDVRALVEHHAKRIQWDRAVPFVRQPSEDTQAWHHSLQQVNHEAGFFNPLEDQEALGRISYEGRYRMWTQHLTLRYLGFA